LKLRGVQVWVPFREGLAQSKPGPPPPTSKPVIPGSAGVTLREDLFYRICDGTWVGSRPMIFSPGSVIGVLLIIAVAVWVYRDARSLNGGKKVGALSPGLWFLACLPFGVLALFAYLVVRTSTPNPSKRRVSLSMGAGMCSIVQG
jgi:hypothetical protein